MDRHTDVVTCHWLTPTRIMPHPFSIDAETSPWTCLRDGMPRALSAGEIGHCAHCPRWEERTLEDVQRDIAYETWGVGIDVPERRTIADARRDLIWETFGLKM